MSRAPTVVEELEQEMKLLHWHKLANEAALKAALIRSKRLKARDNRVMFQESKQQERAVWIQKVLEEEQQKPLEVNDDFIRGHEAREQRNEAKLAQQVSRHVETLQALKDSLRKREEEKRRVAVYKEKKRALGPAPTRLEDFPALREGGSGGLQSTGRSSNPAGTGTASSSGYGGGGRGAGDTTAPVAPNLLQSLNRLVELEKRITKLEDMDGYEPASTPRSRGSDPQVSAAALRGKAMTFTKKRTVAAPGAPAKTVFAVKLVDKSVAAASRRRAGAGTGAPLNVGAGAGGTGGARANAASRNWLSDRQATQASRRARMESDYSTARGGAGAGAGAGLRAGASAGLNGRGSASRLTVTAPVRGAGAGAGVGSRTAVAARQVAASRTALTGARVATMGSSKLVGRGAAHMTSFVDMRREFEARKAAARGPGAGAGAGAGVGVRGRQMGVTAPARVGAPVRAGPGGTGAGAGAGSRSTVRAAGTSAQPPPLGAFMGRKAPLGTGPKSAWTGPQRSALPPVQRRR